jgi:hypothetical protein
LIRTWPSLGERLVSICSSPPSLGSIAWAHLRRGS